MAVLGFRHHPGPLPFSTVREKDKWGPRLTNGMIEIRGEGCELAQQMCRVVKIEAEPLCPLELQSLYGNKPLIRVYLEAV